MARFFNFFPKTLYYKDHAAIGVETVTNIVARVGFEPSFKDNTAVYYEYDIQDGDTPETVAYKYYGDSYRYWIILYSNQIMNPLWDWPLSSNDFNAYIADKYQSFDPYSTVYQYQKIITQFDSSTLTTTTNTVTIDNLTYNNLVLTTNTYSLPTGNVTVSVTKNAVSYYDYELGLNEAKRTISILNRNYADQLETEFKSLMKQ